jgi:hypothetical protein
MAVCGGGRGLVVFFSIMLTTATVASLATLLLVIVLPIDATFH